MLADALYHLPAANRQRALELAASSSLTGFENVQAALPSRLAELPPDAFDFITGSTTFDTAAYPERVVLALREAVRLLKENGLLCASFPKLLSTGELTELARDLDFQILTLDAVTSRSTHILWRKRPAGWRLPLADHAALAAARITKVSNNTDHSPVVPSRGRYTTIAIAVNALPLDLDLADLAIRIGGLSAVTLSIAHNRILARLPNLEVTGLVPIELRWFGESLTSDDGYIRVIPPGPIVPRIVSIITGETRLAGVTFEIEQVARPDELSASLDGTPLWGLDARCVDLNDQLYEIRLPVPEEVAAGRHEIQFQAGRRKLAPVTVEIV